MVNKVSFKIKLQDLVSKETDISKVPKYVTTKIRKDVGKFILSSVNKDASESRSSVSGQTWKGLSKEYAKVKSRITMPVANLNLHGDMLKAFKKKDTVAGIEFGIFNKKQAQKADGHCKLGVYGQSSLPKRQFIPSQTENYRPGIMNKAVSMAKKIVKDWKDTKEMNRILREEAKDNL